MTSGRYRSCSATRTSARPWSTPMCSTREGAVCGALWTSSERESHPGTPESLPPEISGRPTPPLISDGAQGVRALSVLRPKICEPSRSHNSGFQQVPACISDFHASSKPLRPSWVWAHHGTSTGRITPSPHLEICGPASPRLGVMRPEGLDAKSLTVLRFHSKLQIQDRRSQAKRGRL